MNSEPMAFQDLLLSFSVVYDARFGHRNPFKQIDQSRWYRLDAVLTRPPRLVNVVSIGVSKVWLKLCRSQCDWLIYQVASGMFPVV